MMEGRDRSPPCVKRWCWLIGDDFLTFLSWAFRTELTGSVWLKVSALTSLVLGWSRRGAWCQTQCSLQTALSAMTKAPSAELVSVDEGHPIFMHVEGLMKTGLLW